MKKTGMNNRLRRVLGWLLVCLLLMSMACAEEQPTWLTALDRQLQIEADAADEFICVLTDNAQCVEVCWLSEKAAEAATAAEADHSLAAWADCKAQAYLCYQAARDWLDQNGQQTLGLRLCCGGNSAQAEESRRYVLSDWQDGKRQDACAVRDLVTGDETPTIPEQEEMVYISKSGKKYHHNPNCGNIKTAIEISLTEAVERGYEPCKRCVK